MDASKRLAKSERHLRLARLTGETIRRERHLLHWTQGKLAHEADLTTETLGRIERGEIFVTYPKLMDILYALDLPEAACMAILRHDAELRRVAA
ncbi:helix-turn-helix domain-containing protein [Gluconobacter sp.]|uniref:helix-turn-helix domain-containing protein n=1 Tax=Gluconobacter sp. TaxID=1876758 RepID=UPI0039EA3FA7